MSAMSKVKEAEHEPQGHCSIDLDPWSFDINGYSVRLRVCVTQALHSYP